VLKYGPPEWLFAFAALYVSHGVSFVVNFLFRRELDDALRLLLC